MSEGLFGADPEAVKDWEAEETLPHNSLRELLAGTYHTFEGSDKLCARCRKTKAVHPKEPR